MEIIRRKKHPHIPKNLLFSHYSSQLFSTLQYNCATLVQIVVYSLLGTILAVPRMTFEEVLKTLSAAAENVE